MFVSSDDFQAPQLTPRRMPRGEASFWEGLGAGWRQDAMETNAYGQVQRVEQDARQTLRAALDEAMGAEEVERRLRENAPRREQPAARARREASLLFEMAQEAAGENPETFRDLPTTSQAMQEYVQQRYQAEYQDVLDTSGMVSTLPGLANFLGRAGSAVSDPTSIGLGLVSGGSGTIARIFGREVALGVLGEATVLPRQYRMADYLNIDDPNPIAQLALGGLFAGGLYGGIAAATRPGRRQISQEFARALEYARARTQTIPTSAPDTSIETQAIIDAAEDALVANDRIFDDPFTVTPAQAPAEPPQRPQEPEPAPTGPDETERLLEAEIEALRQSEGLPPKPLSRRLINETPERLPDGTLRTWQIRPGGQAAQTLNSLGITSRSRPGLFSRRGRDDLDNLVADEWEDDFPGIADLAGRSDDGLYLNQDGFLQALARELNNEELDIGPNRRLRELEQQLADYQRARDTADDPIRPIEGDDPLQIADDAERVRNDVLTAISGKGLDDLLTAEEKEVLINTIGRYGGRIDDNLDEIGRSELRGVQDEIGSDAEIPWDEPGNAAPAQGGRGAIAETGPDTGATVTGRAGQDDGGAPRTEQTAAGEQQLIEGVEPITQRQRLEQRMNARMGGDPQGPDSQVGGLFDPNDKQRMDLFDDPQGDALNQANIRAAQDMREFMDAEPDFDIEMEFPDANGNMKTMTAREWLDEVDADEALIREVNQCRIGGPE